MKKYAKAFKMTLATSILLALSFSCKSVSSGKHKNDNDVGSPMIETSPGKTPAGGSAAAIPILNPAGATKPQIETAIGMGEGEALAAASGFLPDPLPADPIPALTQPNNLQVFSLRSLPIEQNGKSARQYRVDLPGRKVSLDNLNRDVWQETQKYTLTDEQMQKIKAALSGLTTGVYPSCKPCKKDVHLFVLEGLENNKKAQAFAMSEPCTCDGNDERKATVPFAALKQIADILNK